MTDRLIHRGPDGFGELHLDEVLLGHRRLSIIDLAHSAQPMSTPDGRFHLTYNGEIFNYREIRRELEASGAVFRTSGDTEVLLQSLCVWGERALDKLNGQFAFAFYDSHSRELLLCRDRMGILPLFYTYDGSRFVFASEIKAILALPWIRAELNDQAIERYLATRSTKAPATLFRDIQKLEPGSLLRLDSSGRVTKIRWWTLPSPDYDIIDMKAAKEEVYTALIAAVKARLVADVPVGAFLSGGLDSSLITALTSRLNEKPVTCFVAGFGDPRFDEVPFAEEVARHCGLDLEVVQTESEHFVSAYEKLTWTRDAPLSEPGDVAVYYIATKAAEQVKVMLSGEGADELFAGYPKHRYDQIVGSLMKLPARARTIALSSIEKRLSEKYSRLRVAVRAGGSRSAPERWLNWFAPFVWYELKGFRDQYGDILDDEVQLDGDPVNAMLRNDCGQWLSDNLLERGDRMSMAASVECRPPFMDHELIQTAFRIPGHMKCNRKSGKLVLREIAKDLLPASIISRKKVGFKVPIDEWFRNEMREYVFDHLVGRGSFVAEYLGKRNVENILMRHESGMNEDLKIWTLLGLEVWKRRFL